MQYLIYDPEPDSENSPTARLVDTATGIVYDYELAGGDPADKLWDKLVTTINDVAYVNPSEE